MHYAQITNHSSLFSDMLRAKYLPLLLISIFGLSLHPIIILQYTSSKRTVSYISEMGIKLPSQPPSPSLLKLNENRWKRLKEYYIQYLNLTAFYQPSSNKTMIYSCHSTCYGWGDRLRGITSAYILALLSRRRFMIDMDHPCSISHVLQPNIIDWRYRKPTSSQLANRTKLTINAMPLWPKSIRQTMTHLIQSEDFISLWSKYDDIHITTNGFYITDALQNPLINASWLLGTLPAQLATQQSLFPLLFELLFKPKPIVYQAVDSILRRNHQQLTCLHIRLGKNPSNPHDIKFPHRINMTTIMLDFLAKNSFLVNLKKTLLFIASDSEQAIKDVFRKYPKVSVNVPGPIMHIDNHDNRNVSARRALCAGLVKVLVEFYTLGECQYSLLSRSGFSLWANKRRVNPDEHLYVFDEKWKIMKTSKS